MKRTMTIAALSLLLLAACTPSVPRPAERSDAGSTSPTDAATPTDASVRIDAPGPIDASWPSDAGPDAQLAEDDAGDAPPAPATCPATLPSDWIFCDDFEREDVSSRYFEMDDDGGEFRRADTRAASGRHAMEVVFQAGEVDAGDLKITFGRSPLRSLYRSSEDFVEVYWRMRLLQEEGWIGSPGKLSRATAFARSDWSQAMIAHLWSSGDVLIGDPAGCVSGSSVRCSGYNDFGELAWLGQLPGETPIFSTTDAGRWRCIEGHVRLNTPGSSDGVFEIWIDSELQSARTDLDWRGAYTEYAINAVFLENYWNSGSPVEQRRYFDDLVIAQSRIGCE